MHKNMKRSTWLVLIVSIIVLCALVTSFGLCIFPWWKYRSKLHTSGSFLEVAGRISRVIEWMLPESIVGSSSVGTDDDTNVRWRRKDYYENTRTRWKGRSTPLQPPAPVGSNSYTDCGLGVYVEYTSNTNVNNTLSTCVCPLDWTGGSCDLPRSVNCSSVLQHPVLNCDSILPVKGMSSCLRFDSHETVEFKFRLQCSFTDGAKVYESLGSTTVLKVLALGSRTEELGNTDLSIGLKGNISYFINSFKYAGIRYPNSSVHHLENAEFMISRDQKIDYFFSPLDSIHMVSKYELNCTLTPDQWCGVEPVIFDVNFGSLPNSYKKTGRLYAEVGFAYRDWTFGMMEENKDWYRLSVDFTDYVEPPGSESGDLLLIWLCLSGAVCLAVLISVGGVAYHKIYIRKLRSIKKRLYRS